MNAFSSYSVCSFLVATRALKIRITSSARWVKQTNTRRLSSECPMIISRRSFTECLSSSKMTASESSNTVEASSKVTACLRWLDAAFLVSHTYCTSESIPELSARRNEVRLSWRSWKSKRLHERASLSRNRKGDRLLFQSQELMPATGRGRVHLDGARRDWSELIDKKNGEIKGREFFWIVNAITALAGNVPDGPKRMRGRIECPEFML